MHLRWTITSKNLEKKKKIVFDVVWWSLFSSKLFIKQILLYQTRFACLMHLSRISSNNLYFITTLSAKHKRWSVFRTFLTFECSKKPKKQNKIKTGHFSKWKTNHQVMFSNRDSEFEADPLKNGDLFQKRLATKKKDDKKTQDKKAEREKRIRKQILWKTGRMTRFHY